MNFPVLAGQSGLCCFCCNSDLGGKLDLLWGASSAFVYHFGIFKIVSQSYPARKPADNYLLCYLIYDFQRVRVHHSSWLERWPARSLGVPASNQSMATRAQAGFPLSCLQPDRTSTKTTFRAVTLEHLARLGIGFLKLMAPFELASHEKMQDAMQVSHVRGGRPNQMG